MAMCLHARVSRYNVTRSAWAALDSVYAVMPTEREWWESLCVILISVAGILRVLGNRHNVMVGFLVFTIRLLCIRSTIGSWVSRASPRCRRNHSSRFMHSHCSIQI